MYGTAARIGFLPPIFDLALHILLPLYSTPARWPLALRQRHASTSPEASNEPPLPDVAPIAWRAWTPSATPLPPCPSTADTRRAVPCAPPHHEVPPCPASRTGPAPAPRAATASTARVSMDGGDGVHFPPPAALLRPDPPTTGASTADDGVPGAAGAAAKPKSTSTAALSKGKAAKPQLAAEGSAPVKPKQSKSRNGCVTCKQKRLKCDETKPSCQQCHRRQVTCGGYKKDYKWRPLGEASFAPVKGPASSSAAVQAKGKAEGSSERPPAGKHHPSASTSSDTTGSAGTPQNQNSYSLLNRDAGPASAEPSPRQGEVVLVASTDSTVPQGPLSAISSMEMRHCLKTKEVELRPSNTPLTAGSGSWQLGLDKTSPDLDPFQVREFEDPDLLEGASTGPGFDDPDVEDILPEGISEDWTILHDSDFDDNYGYLDFNLVGMLLREPKFSPTSAEMLLAGFDKHACGILSIRDGPTENPWRTAILPLVHESDALYHALAAITAFQPSTMRPDMKRAGVAHMRASVQLLARDLRHMRPDIALAITLILAFAESWDVHITTGIKHLQGAKQFIRQALPVARQLGPANAFAQRIAFLCNTWVYMDVIARLTSLDADDSTDFDAALQLPMDATAPAAVDPLMGCAAALFPLIGRVANLVRTVRRSARNGLPLIQHAAALQAAIAAWAPPLAVAAPEDTTCAVPDAVRTAEAYRWATLLYLHQAVPELASPPAAALARRALAQLALVSLTSRTTIVHIYPLLAAGCEAATPADRAWVAQRWRAMAQRMLIGNVDRCLEVVREVWARRDAVDAAAGRGADPRPAPFSPSWGLASLQLQDPRVGADAGLSPGMPFSPSTPLAPTEAAGAFGSDTPPVPIHPFDPSWPPPPDSDSPLHPGPGPRPAPERRTSAPDDATAFERSVRGRQHWVGVMQDWNWEGLLFLPV